MKAASEDISIFISVVEHGSFSRAAEKLDIANSAASRAVKKLEKNIGVTLLNRTTRNLSLTEEGERYFHRMKAIFQDIDSIEKELIDGQASPKGLLRIDAATPVILHLLTPLIKQFKAIYPNINLSLVSSENHINLIERKVDIAIRIGYLTDSSLRARPLFKSYRKIVVSPKYLAEHGCPTSAEALLSHTCLTFTGVDQLNIWPIKTSNNQFIEVSDGISSNSGETLRQLCIEGNGIACLSDFMINKDIKEGRLIEILSTSLQPVAMPLNAVYYSEKHVSQRIRVFLDFLNDVISKSQVI